jgi:hypothetical protein
MAVDASYPDDMFFSQIKAIKLVTGVTVTCWRPPYGDVDVSVWLFL